MSFVDKQVSLKKPRGSFLIPTVPRRDSKSLSTHFSKRPSLAPKITDAELTCGNLFVGM